MTGKNLEFVYDIRDLYGESETQPVFPQICIFFGNAFWQIFCFVSFTFLMLKKIV